MKIKRIHTPLTEDQIRGLKAGDQVRICGTIYTARDAAHAKMVEALEKGQPLPMELEGALIYYAGPTPAKPGMPVGSLGPTTSGRMDAFAPKLLAQGLKGMMGKGPRSQAVQEAAVRYGAVYFAALGGAGALDAVVLSGVTAVMLCELAGEIAERIARGRTNGSTLQGGQHA